MIVEIKNPTMTANITKEKYQHQAKELKKLKKLKKENYQKLLQSPKILNQEKEKTEKI